MTTTRSLQVQEMIALIALEGGRLESTRRVDFLAKHAVGGHKENFLEGGCGAVLGTNFDPRNRFWRYRDHEIRFVSEPLLKRNLERPEASADRAPIPNLKWGLSASMEIPVKGWQKRATWEPFFSPPSTTRRFNLF
jgi:hypothetical protein